MPRRVLGAARPRRASARRIAHDVLVRVETTDAFADVLLEHRLRDTALPARDRRLTTRLVLGTLAWQGWLDARIAAVLDRPLDDLDAPVRAALRLGAFQLLRLDRIPRHAAIDESVALAGHRGARALVNAVLRRIGPSPGGSPDAGAPLAALAETWSHPEWLVRLLDADVEPTDLAALLAADNEPAPTALRVHPGRATPASVCATLAADGIGARPGRWAPSAVVVTDGAADLRGHRLMAEGVVTVQSEASQLVVTLLDPSEGEIVADLCAAPGGKTGAIAERIGDAGMVVGLDPSFSGTARIRGHGRRVAPRPVVAVVGDARRPPLRAGAFDAVLVDAPCSGLGTLRRHPEIRWRCRPEDLERLALRQRAILDGAASLVRPGGRLVYAVCTPTRAETWDVVRPWLETQPRFRIEPAGETLGPRAAPLVHGDALRTLPAPHGLDGFFAVRLRAAG